MEKDTVVIGIGNTLMGDEGIGCKIAEHFSAHSQDYPSIEFVDISTGGMKLLHIISGRKKALLIDCAVMGTEAGTMRRFTPEQAQSVKQLSHYSLHEVDVLKIIAMAHSLGDCPDEIVLFGIEPERIELGQHLSETLTARFDDYVTTIAKELRE